MRLTEWTPDRALDVAFGQLATEDEMDDLGGGRQKYAQISAEEWAMVAKSALVLLQECAALAARHLDGKQVYLQWLPSNVSDACRKLEKADDAMTEDARMTALLREQGDALDADRLARLDAYYAEHPEEVRA